MSLKVLIAPDKFKGTLSARAAAESMARGWLRGRPGDEVELFPISDGGDGFGELVSARLGAEVRQAWTTDAAHRLCQIEWWYVPHSRTAIIEAARANGLAQLPPGKYHPFELDTFGLGELFQAVAQAGARRCLVGIGGSATNDAGFGMARALGWVFVNAHGDLIERWTELHALAHFRCVRPLPEFDQVLVAVDVQNRLLGPQGCTRVYGPQKGLCPEDFEFAERCLGRLAEVVARELHRSVADEPGTGAAGGLGFGLSSFLQARLEPGFALLALHTGLKERVAQADLVVTGEGAIDGSSLMGKGVGELARWCQQCGLPCVGLAGQVGEEARASRLFGALHALAPDVASREQALAEPSRWLELLTSRVAAAWR